MKQLGLALHNFADAHGRVPRRRRDEIRTSYVPTGTADVYNDAASICSRPQRYTAQALLFPYVEQNNLYAELTGLLDKAKSTGDANYMPSPTDGSAIPTGATRNPPTAKVAPLLRPSDGLAARRFQRQRRPYGGAGYLRNVGDSAYQNTSSRRNTRRRGVFVNFAKAGQTTLAPSRRGSGGGSKDDFAISTPSSDRGGVDVVMRDGSVRFVSETIDCGDVNNLTGGAEADYAWTGKSYRGVWSATAPPGKGETESL